LGTADLTASTVANIGPGIDFYFAFGVIAVTAGVAAPLTILAAGVAVVLLAFTVAEFTKVERTSWSDRLSPASRSSAIARASSLEERISGNRTFKSSTLSSQLFTTPPSSEHCYTLFCAR
jgi:hypothetical protein